MRVAFSAFLAAGLAVVLASSYRSAAGLTDYTVLVSGAGLVCCLLLLGAHLRHRAAAGPAITGAMRLAPPALVRLLAFAALWTAYIVVLPYWGFMLSTWLALVLSLALVRGRPTVRGALGTALFVFVFAVLIKSVLYVPVPQGALDTQLDEVLYDVLQGGGAS